MKDKNAVLETNPHYSNPRFKTEQTVFGRMEQGLEYSYSDRIVEWDYKKARAAALVADASGAAKRTCSWYEAYLSAFFERHVEIRHIIAGVNRSNGYPYRVFGYKFIGEVQ